MYQKHTHIVHSDNKEKRLGNAQNSGTELKIIDQPVYASMPTSLIRVHYIAKWTGELYARVLPAVPDRTVFLHFCSRENTTHRRTIIYNTLCNLRI